MRYVFLVILLGISMATSVSADTTVRTAERFELTEDQVVTGNFLGFGNPVTLSGEVEEDALLFGNRVTVSGFVAQDVLAAGVFVTHDGVVQQDIKAVGGEVVISGTVAGDVFVAAGTVTITSEAEIGGDVVVYAGDVTVAGAVAGDVVGSMSTLAIDSAVGGGVDVVVGQLDLGQNASITQAVQYESSALVTQNINTIVVGDVVRSDPQTIAESPLLPRALFVLLLVLFATLVWVLASAATLGHVTYLVYDHPGRSVLVGWGAGLLVPVIVGVLFMSVFGSFVAVVLLFGYVTCVLLALAATPVVIGQALMRVASIESVSTTSLVVVLLGALACVGLIFVPYVGPVLLAVVAISTFGGIVEAFIRKFT